VSVEISLNLHSPRYALGAMTSRSLAVVILIVLICEPHKTVNLPHVGTCHKSCSCKPVDTDPVPTINVQCGKRNLTEVPNMTFIEPVSILDVSFNELKTLEKEALCHYESVTYLHLQRCRLLRISEEAFHCLVKLTFVDLSDNLFISISPDLFIRNQHLHELILRGNRLVDLQWNVTLLNGPPHLSKLDLQSCKLKKLSSKTFSLLPNLQCLDISYNELELLNYETLSSHQQLDDVNLDNNRWRCGHDFYDLLLWIKSKEAVPHNRTVTCRYKNGTKELWTPAKQSSLCRLNTTPSVNSSYKTDMNTSWTLNTTVIWSNISEVSPNTTLNPTTKLEEETDTTGVRQSIIFFIVVIVAIIVTAIITAIIGVKLVCLLRRPDSHIYEEISPNL